MIKDLLERYEENLAVEKEKIDRELETRKALCLKGALELIEKYLPDLADCEFTAAVTNQDSDIDSFLYLYAVADVSGLERFWVMADFYQPQSISHPGPPIVRVQLLKVNPTKERGYYQESADLSHKDPVLKFLYARKTEYNEIEASKIAGTIKRTVDSFDTGYIKDVNAAQVAFDHLVELAPDQVSDWDYLYQKWQREYETVQLILQRTREENIKQAKLEDAFKQDYLAWLRESVKVFQQNLEIVQKLQAVFDVPFPISQLEYAIVVNEDGEQYAETDFLTIVPYEDGHVVDEEGYFQLLRYKSSPIRKWHIRPEKIIGHSKLEYILPTDKRHYDIVYLESRYFGVGRIFVTGAERVYFSPLESSVVVEKMLKEHLIEPLVMPSELQNQIDVQLSFSPVIREVRQQIKEEFGLDD